MSPALALPGWIEEQRQRLRVLSCEVIFNSALDDLEARWQADHETISTRWAQLDSELYNIYEFLVECHAHGDLHNQFWAVMCQALQNLLSAQTHARRELETGEVAKLSAVGMDYYRDVDRFSTAAISRCVELARLVLVENPEWGLTLPGDLDPIVWTVRISPLAYMRTMWNLFWSALRHPFSNTTIDLSTGRVLYRS